MRENFWILEERARWLDEIHSPQGCPGEHGITHDAGQDAFLDE